MAIQTNDVNVSALAALASQHEGNIGLKTVGGSPIGAYSQAQAQGLQNFQQNQLQASGQANQAQIAAASNATQLQNTQLQTQGQLQVGQQAQLAAMQQQKQAQAAQAAIAAQQTGLGYAGLQSQQGIAQGQLGLGQAQLAETTRNDLAQQQLAQKAQAQAKLQSDLQMRMSMNSYQLHVRGASAAMGLSVLNNAPDAATAQQASNQWADTQLQQGVMTQEEHDQFVASPIAARQQQLGRDFLLSDMSAKAGALPGVGQAILGNMALPQTNQAQATTAVQNSRQVQSQNQGMRDLINNNPQVFTGKGNVQAAEGGLAARYPQIAPALSGIANAVGLPLDQAQQASTAEQQINTQGQAMKMSLAANTKMRLSPVTEAMFDPLIPNPSVDSQAEALAKLDVSDQVQNNIQKLNATALSRGVPVNPASYETQVQSIIQKGVSQYNKGLAGKSSNASNNPTNVPTSYTSKTRGKTYSPAELQQISAMNGNMPIADVMKNLN